MTRRFAPIAVLLALGTLAAAPANDSRPLVGHEWGRAREILIAHGLYPREAEAMADTWRDSWFEEGTRLFYIAPRTAIDAILPLEITPPPDKIARVFVGRIELVTSRIEREVEAAMAANDRQALGRYGRFLQPIADRLLARLGPAARAGMQTRLEPVYASEPTARAACR